MKTDPRHYFRMTTSDGSAHSSMTVSEAVVESQACLQCGGPVAPAPCTAACPTGIDIPGFIKDIADGMPVEAARKIFEKNILGGSCARVCPVEELCQGMCVLKFEGRRAIEIGRLQRHATDKAMADHAAVTPVVPRVKREESVAVIGAGPAGLGCAAELARLGYRVTVYEMRDQPGGLVVHGIAPYKQLVDPLPREAELIRQMGVTFRYGVRVGWDVSVEQLRREHAAVFVGVGMGDDLPAKIPGENMAGIWESLPFIEKLKLGNPGEMQLGQRVAIIGGGNTAIDVAREARMLGIPEVMMLYRRTEAQMPAYRHEIAAAKAEGVKIMELVAPMTFVGDDRVRGVRCVRMELGPPDASGRPKPVPMLGSEFIVEVDSVVKAIGQAPRSEFFKKIGLNTDWNIKVDGEMQTGEKWAFAGGDVINGGATVVEAVRDGREAAKAIDRYLTGRAKVPAPTPAPSRVERDNGTIKYFQGNNRLMMAPALCKGCNICVTGCPSDTLALDNAGKIIAKDGNTCVYCGICEARCPDFAIWVVKDEKAEVAV